MRYLIRKFESSAIRKVLYVICLTAFIINPASVSATTLALEIKFDKAEYLLGEPVYMTAILRNTGDKPVNAPSWFNAKTSDLRINIIRPDGKQIGYVPLAFLDSDEPYLPLSPGSVVAAVIPVFYGGRGWTFDAPGDYSVRAIYNPRGIKVFVASNKVNLLINKAESEAGRFLFSNGKASDEAGKFLLWQSGDHLRQGIAHLENLADKYPKSLINNYAWLAIGKNYSRQFRDYSINRVRPPQYENAIKYLNRVEDHAIPNHLRALKYIASAKSNIGLGRKAAARNMLEKAKANIGDSPALMVHMDTINRLTKSLVDN